MADTQGQRAQASLDYAEFEKQLDTQFKIKTDDARSGVRSAVRTLAQQLLDQHKDKALSDDLVHSVEDMIAEIDAALGRQVNLILHHAEFQQLEGAWRGLHHLVNRSMTGEDLTIRVLNIGKSELQKTLKKFEGVRWDKSPIFAQIYGAEFDQAGGTPYGCIVGDYQFDHGAQDVAMLESLARIGAAAHCPIIAGASASLMRMEDWSDLRKVTDVASQFNLPEYAAWKALRAKSDSRYLALAMPRFLARVPYGAKTEPVEAFAFEEDIGGRHDRYVWSNAAYAMAANITRSFKEYGWFATIRGENSGGAVEGLPVHTFPTDDGGQDMKCPTELALGFRREGELSKAGLLPLIHQKGSNAAVFYGAQTVHQPEQYANPEATKNAELGARLTYLLSTCRFAHYLKKMMTSKIGESTNATQLQEQLQEWITLYVDGDPDRSSPEVKAQKPLRDAIVEVKEDPENPGYYAASFQLLPHHQLEGMTVSLSLVSRLEKKQ